VINAQKFNQTMRVMNGEEVTLTVERTLSALLECGKSTHRMTALKGEDFPELPRLESSLGFSVKTCVLKDMFSKTMYAMGVNDQRVVLNGCYVEVEEGKLLLVSCDSFKLAKCQLETSEIENKNENQELISKFISLSSPTNHD
jgi:DNA polymerase-3 subunit beta